GPGGSVLGKADDFRSAKPAGIGGNSAAGMAHDSAGRLLRNGSREILNQGPDPTCGPVSAAMVIRGFGRHTFAGDVVTFARQKGWLTESGMFRSDIPKL